MKFLLVALIFSLSSNFTYSEENSDLDVKKLVYSTPDDESSEEYYSWVEKIKTARSISPNILKLLKNEENWELFYHSFSALRVRGDLELRDLEKLLDEAISIADSPKAPTMSEKIYASGIFSLLEDYPSETNEEILVKYFDCHDGSFRTSIINALGSIGTEKCLPKLKQFIDVHTTEYGADTHANLTSVIYEKIERREQLKNRGDARNKAITDVTTPSQRVTDDASQMDETESTSTQSKFIVLAIALVLISLGYQFIAKSRQRQ
jgi:HEAT repeat protein